MSQLTLKREGRRLVSSACNVIKREGRRLVSQLDFLSWRLQLTLKREGRREEYSCAVIGYFYNMILFLTSLRDVSLFVPNGTIQLIMEIYIYSWHRIFLDTGILDEPNLWKHPSSLRTYFHQAGMAQERCRIPDYIMVVYDMFQGKSSFTQIRWPPVWAGGIG